MLRIQDWGDQDARFESQSIDVMLLTTVSISAGGLTIGGDVQNGANEFFEYFYTLDGGTDVTTDISLSADTAGTAVNWAITSLDVSGVDFITVGFNFQVNGSGDGYEISEISVDDMPAPGVTVTLGGGSLDVEEGGATDTFDVVLDAPPNNDVTINLSNPDGEVSLSTSSLTFTNGNWNTPQSVTVTAVNDGDEEGGHPVISPFRYRRPTGTTMVWSFRTRSPILLITM